MDNTLKPERSNQIVPLQRSTAVWQDEPGYGGTPSAWDQFGLKIDQLLKELEEQHPAPRRIPTTRPR
jgi:hypothetical protein